MIDIEQLNKKEYYDVPEGYFDQLPNQIMGAIRKERTFKRNITISSIAAVFLIIICSTLVINYKKDDISSQKDIAIEKTGNESTLEEQMADYYSTEFAQMDYYDF